MQIYINLEEMNKWQIKDELRKILSQLDPISAHEIVKELREEFLSIEELQEKIKNINA
ncbi:MULTISPECIES: hypothetical protein [Campylobacter]|uniref:hypothetical protein n=1 Tax=Campylobacter TaxID=194 RepID=UPI001DCD7C59|nr:hypothetical protein [Campylobacter sp. W0065]MBZ7939518.1 hypothetical protein [Campylobacter sp. W0014]MBZ7941243.1 hypothetical protein [Campylobacter sp. W0047]MBZ7960303.1 hypothetical protein [Campylobacter sp. RM12397]MBZ7967756.1 hypothetical protein [Campylobacter sp. RM9756]